MIYLVQLNIIHLVHLSKLLGVPPEKYNNLKIMKKNGNFQYFVADISSQKYDR